MQGQEQPLWPGKSVSCGMGSGCRGTGAAGPALASAEHRNAAAEGVWIFPQGLGGCNIMSCASRRPEPAQTRREAASCSRQVTDPRGTCELWLGAVCGQGTGNTRLPPNTGQVSRSSARPILSPGPPLFSPSTALLVWAVLQRSASSSPTHPLPSPFLTPVLPAQTQRGVSTAEAAREGTCPTAGWRGQ